MKTEDLTIKEINEGLENKDFSDQEITEEFLDNIEEKDQKLNAFLEVRKEEALQEAKKVDKLLEEGKEISKLAGIPCSIKDNILLKDTKCTAASKILKSYKAPFDAEVVRKLKEQNSVFLGKNNMDEFAMGASNENSAFGPVLNPVDNERVPGGSSGGPAASVKASEAVFSLGSDTGGSIRQPASFCGTVGLKPTYGAVSRYGLIAFGSSLDQIGPITQTVEDAKIVFNSIKGKDKKDSTSQPIQSKDFPEEKIKVGIPKEYFQEGVEEKIKTKIQTKIKRLEKEKVTFKKVSLPHTKYALPAYYLIATSEASANLARFDGIRYGGIDEDSLEGITELKEFYKKTRGKGFGPEVKRRIMLGTYALSEGYFEDFYLKAQKARTLIKEDFKEVFKKVDFLFTPVSPNLPFKIGEKSDDPLKMYMSDILTIPASLAGLPALSVPIGKQEGLPVGVQIIGDYFQEESLFKIGKLIEKIR